MRTRTELKLTQQERERYKVVFNKIVECGMELFILVFL